MLEIIDDFCWTKDRKIITRDKHHVPGLENFSHFSFLSSSPLTPLHYHTDIIELFCMINGRRQTQIEIDGELKNFITSGNQIIITFPYQVHGNGSGINRNEIESQVPYEFYACQINVSNPYCLLGLNEEYSYALYKMLMNLKYNQFNLGSTLEKNIIAAFNLFSGLKPETTRIGVQYLTCFLFNLEFLMPSESTNKLNIEPSISKAIEYVKKNITEDVRVSDLADISGYSVSRFKVVFKECLGITSAYYIDLQKFERIKILLSDSNNSITDISCELGFSSVSYFSSFFKKYANCSPKEYRKYCYALTQDNNK